MLQTLEGVLVALLMAMAPADRPSDSGSTTLAELRLEALAACEPYTSDTARRNCIVRLERGLESADAGAVFTEQVTWVAPSDPGMPDRAALLRRSR